MEGTRVDYREKNLNFFIGRCREMEKIDAENIFTRLGEVLLRYLPIDELKIFDFNGSKGTGRIKIYIGQDTDPPRNIFLSGYCDISEILGRRGAVSVDRGRAAILIRHRGDPIAFVEIGTGLESGFSPEDIELFEAMAEYTENELEKNEGVFERYRNLRNKLVLNEREYEGKKKHLEERYKRFGTEYSELRVEIEEKLWKAVEGEVLELLRSTDYFRYHRGRENLLVLLPCTSQERGEHLKKRLENYLEEIKRMG